MPYAVRNADGEITSLHRHDPGVGEFLPDDDAGVRAFVGLAPGQGAGFDRLDAEFVRVIEDVIDTLTERNVINITDLPETAQAKLFARKNFRDRRAKKALQLFEPTNFQDVI
jgi:hypothetical protein